MTEKATLPVSSGVLAVFAGKVALVAAFVGMLVAVGYLYVTALGAAARLDANIEQILSVVERPAHRSVLILDQHLSSEVVKSLMVFNHIERAAIYDDHGNVAAELKRGSGDSAASFSLAGLFVPGEKTTYSRLLKMPEGLDGHAFLQVTVDQDLGLANVAGPTLSGLLLFFLLGACTTFGFAISTKFLKHRLHSYLMTQYRLRPV